MFSVSKISVLFLGVAAAQETTFPHRIFHDFRSLDGRLYPSKPANITNDEESSSASVQSGYLTSNVFTNDFDIQTWGAPVSEVNPVRKQNSNQNVYIERGEDGLSTHLVLRAYRNKDFISSAEVVSKVSNIFHASIRVRARVRGDAGACAGIFTYHDDNNESDIEILTRDPTNHIRYTNQPTSDEDGNEIPGASTDAVMEGGAVWTDWNNHTLSWNANLSSWFLDGALAHTKTHGIPTTPSTLHLNMWGNGGAWTKPMEIGSAAYLDIEWIEILYDTT